MQSSMHMTGRTVVQQTRKASRCNAPPRVVAEPLQTAPTQAEYQEALTYMMHVRRTMVEGGSLESFNTFANLLTACHNGQ